ncbi:MAG: pantetheine-phosphate adenylyltransferase [Bradymonadaceae bacterium]
MGLSAVYPGSFDPITSGHLDIVRRGSELFEAFHLLIAYNDGKDHMFSGESRERIVRRTVEAMDCDPVVSLHRGLTDDYIVDHAIDVLIRGLRNGDDLRYEMELEEYFQKTTDVEVVYMTPQSEHLKTSSTVVRRFLDADHPEKTTDYLHPVTYDQIRAIRAEHE